MRMRIKITISSLLILAIGLGTFLFTKIIPSTYRYSSPKETFNNSGRHGYKLVDVLEEKDVALLIYKKDV